MKRKRRFRKKPDEPAGIFWAQLLLPPFAIAIILLTLWTL